MFYGINVNKGFSLIVIEKLYKRESNGRYHFVLAALFSNTKNVRYELLRMSVPVFLCHFYTKELVKSLISLSVSEYSTNRSECGLCLLF